MSSKADPKFTTCSTLTSSASASMLSATTSGQAVSARLCCSTWTTCLPCFRTCKAKDVHRLFDSDIWHPICPRQPCWHEGKERGLRKEPCFCLCRSVQALEAALPWGLAREGNIPAVRAQGNPSHLHGHAAGCVAQSSRCQLPDGAASVVCFLSQDTQSLQDVPLLKRRLLHQLQQSNTATRVRTQPQPRHSTQAGFAQRSLDGDACFSSLPTARGSPSSNLFQKSPGEPPCPPTASPQQRKPWPSAAGLLMGRAATGRRSQSAPGR